MAHQAHSSEHPIIEKIVHPKCAHPEDSPLCRPVKNLNDKLTAKLGLALQNIINLDIVTGVLTGTYFVYHSWTDVTVACPKQNPSQDHITLPISKIWKPDIVVMNSVEIPEAFDKEALAVIKHTGEVVWCPRARLGVQCTKTANGDWQADLKLVSWVYNRNQIDLDVHDMGMDMAFFTSDKYKVSNASAKRVEFDCPLFGGAPWVLIDFSFTIQVV